MVRLRVQRPDVVPGECINDHQVVTDEQGAGVEQDVMVRAKTQHIVGGIRTAMGLPEWSDVSGFCVPARRCFKDHATDLASVAVNGFHVRADSGVACDPLRGDFCALRFRFTTYQRQLRFRRIGGGKGRMFFDESVAPDVEAALALLSPEVLDMKQAIVSETCVRSVLRLVTPEHPHRDTFHAIDG